MFSVHLTSPRWSRNTEPYHDPQAAGLLAGGAAGGAAGASRDLRRTRWLSWQHTLCERQGLIMLLYPSYHVSSIVRHTLEFVIDFQEKKMCVLCNSERDSNRCFQKQLICAMWMCSTYFKIDRC